MIMKIIEEAFRDVAQQRSYKRAKERVDKEIDELHVGGTITLRVPVDEIIQRIKEERFDVDFSDIKNAFIGAIKNTYFDEEHEKLQMEFLSGKFKF